MLINKTTQYDTFQRESLWQSLEFSFSNVPAGELLSKGGRDSAEFCQHFFVCWKDLVVGWEPRQVDACSSPDEISRVLLWDGRRPVGLALTWAESCCFEAAAGAALWRNYGLPLQPQRLNRPRQFVPNLVRLQVFQPSHLQVEHQVFLAQHSWSLSPDSLVILAGCLLVWWIFLPVKCLVGQQEWDNVEVHWLQDPTRLVGVEVHLEN